MASLKPTRKLTAAGGTGYALTLIQPVIEKLCDGAAAMSAAWVNPIWHNCLDFMVTGQFQVALIITVAGLAGVVVKEAEPPADSQDSGDANAITPAPQLKGD